MNLFYSALDLCYLCIMIFYFSGTGNTRWAAETLAAQTGERLVAIAEALRGDCRYVLNEGERVGFCFPVHGWQPPQLVRRFIERLQLDGAQNAFVYALCTCGDTVGDAIGMLERDMQKKGLRLDAAFSLLMPESYVCLPFMYTDKPEREREKIEKAAKQLEAVVAEVKDRRCGARWLDKGPAPWLYTKVIGEAFNRWMISDNPFTVDKRRCTKCGRCQKICPTQNIVTDADGQPQWLHSGECTCCLACYHHCPVHAIDYGKITKKRGQYYFKVIRD